MITAYLKQTAYQVEIAEDGLAAVEKFTSGAFDLVLIAEESRLGKGVEEHLKASQPARLLAPEGIAKLVPAYLKNRRADLCSLGAALEKNDYNTIRIVGRQMKGSGAGYGFAPISAIGRSLEVAAQEGVGEGVLTQISALSEYLNHVDQVRGANETSVIT